MSIKYLVSYYFNPLKLLYTLLFSPYSYTLNSEMTVTICFTKQSKYFELKLWKWPSYNVVFSIPWILASKCTLFNGFYNCSLYNLWNIFSWFEKIYSNFCTVYHYKLSNYRENKKKWKYIHVNMCFHSCSAVNLVYILKIGIYNIEIVKYLQFWK